VRIGGESAPAKSLL